MVEDLQSTTFLDALWELRPRRRLPKLLISDNATNFKHTEKMLQMISQQSNVKSELDQHGIEWNFTPSRAPWFGGLYERMIGCLKKELDKLTHADEFTKHDFKKNLLEIERVLNSRPITSGLKEEIITPNHILQGGAVIHDDSLNTLDKEIILEEQLKIRKQLPVLYYTQKKRLQRFWDLFWEQYIEPLRFTVDKSQNKHIRIPVVGDIVMLYEKDIRKQDMQKAVVTRLIYSSDGKIRQVEVRLASGALSIRAISQLLCLELEAERYREVDVVKEQELYAQGKHYNSVGVKSVRNAKLAACNQSDGETPESVIITPVTSRVRRLAALNALEKIKEQIGDSLV